ncbi:hypothetical protein [Paracoccus laeviglucosivorans]|uniref:Sulfotransferase family protein n=1 Tax=Paracoccus laeviglucosivorans TaxID=1197861 RepID=A0A521CYY6_9RHOB|nr:hypothetical protein [Paracoccus laeviglucosivorans]SMO63890.1 hypothetical protein SAMN06265221_105219 [Paracoccus laeviglucosivorans]
MGDQPTLLIAGLGRCGTTMLMTMLDAGGFPVTGPRPNYEDARRFGPLRADMEWLAEQSGRAVKLIDPLRYKITSASFPVPPVILLMERRNSEQARSQVKLLTALGEYRNPQRQVVKAMQRSIARDTPLLRAQMGKLTDNVFRVRFEDVLSVPATVAKALAAISRRKFGLDFDIRAARDAVIKRDAACASDLRIENIVLPEIARELAARDAA